MGIREIKMERTRTLIADKAFELFGRQGFIATTVEEIAAAAEVGTRTVYRYYPTKEALVLDPVAKMFDDALRTLREAAPDATIPEALQTILDSALRLVDEQPGRVLAIHDLAQEAVSVRAHLVRLVWSVELELTGEVARRVGGRQADLIAGLAVANTTAVFNVAMRNWLDAHGRADMRRITGSLLELLRSGDVPLPVGLP
ncbi:MULTISPECIES: helix-turn-helix domain-containing protein [unclassified Streptomyces]|uniref:TetR/AcrR family transcriptional regulator n=1 Tax=unclassified Streptomyces TaxID=2593676 RepID=UPI00342CF82C